MAKPFNVPETQIERWKDTVLRRPKSIDPENECDWRDLAYGFFLGLGHDVRTAKRLRDVVVERGLL